jgi:hypothetical protein
MQRNVGNLEREKKREIIGVVPHNQEWDEKGGKNTASIHRINFF